MPATISYDGSVVAPELVLGIQHQARTRNVVHEILGRSAPDITLRPAASRSGTWRLFFLDEESAAAAFDLHTQPGVFVMDYPERPTSNMSYVPIGDVRITLDDTTRTRWVVEVDYREISISALVETEPYPDTIYPDDAFPA